MPTPAAAGEPPRVASDTMVGMQVGAVSFVDEGTNQVLDILQERGAVNTLFLASFTYGTGIGGRQLRPHPFPDHGKQEYDANYHGGNFATPHPQFYERTVLKQTKAPDHGDYDVIADVLPNARRRGMKVYAWYEDWWRDGVPNIDKLKEVDWTGRLMSTMCNRNPDFREFIVGLTNDFCQSYPIDGVMWGSERQGPLHNAIGGRVGRADLSKVGCFCPHCSDEAWRRGIDVDHAKEGFSRLGDFIAAARDGRRPNDGYFVEFWRLLVEFPELIAWEKLWTDGKHAIYRDVHRTAKSVRPEIQVGFHIWHINSFSPFFRAEQNYAELANVADYLKIVMYNNAGGPRYASYLENMSSTIFRDLPKADVWRLHNAWLGYGNEAAIEQLPTAGLSADYVFRETQRAVQGVTRDGRRLCRIYSGLDIDVPTAEGLKKTAPGDVHASTTAALKAGADGVLFCRKYSEMRLANLSAGGKAVREFKG